MNQTRWEEGLRILQPESLELKVKFTSGFSGVHVGPYIAKKLVFLCFQMFNGAMVLHRLPAFQGPAQVASVCKISPTSLTELAMDQDAISSLQSIRTIGERVRLLLHPFNFGG